MIKYSQKLINIYYEEHYIKYKIITFIIIPNHVYANKNFRLLSNHCLGTYRIFSNEIIPLRTYDLNEISVIDHRYFVRSK